MDIHNRLREDANDKKDSTTSRAKEIQTSEGSTGTARLDPIHLNHTFGPAAHGFRKRFSIQSSAKKKRFNRNRACFGYPIHFIHHLANTLRGLHFNGQYLLYSLAFALLYAYLGLGLALILVPRPLKQYSLFLSPLIGYCYLTLIGWYCYAFDLHGTDRYAGYLLLPPLVFLYLGYRHLRQRGERASFRLEGKAIWGPLLVAAVGFLLVSIPYFRDVRGLTSISIRNPDIADSSSVSTYLKEFARSDGKGFPSQSDIFRVLADGSIFGASYSTAFAASLFKKETYQLQSLSVNDLFFFIILMVYLLARDSFQYDHYGGIVVSTFVAISPVLAFTVYNGYQGQIFAMALSLPLLAVHIRLIREARHFSDCYAYFPLVVLFDWGVSLTYPHMLPFVYAPLLSYALLRWFETKQTSPLMTWLAFTAMAFGMMVLLSPHRAVALVRYVMTTGHETAGWFIPWYFTVFGIQSSNPYLHVALSFILGLVITVGLWKAYRGDRSLFLLSAASLLIVVMGFAVLSFAGRSTAGVWGGYKSYKLFSFFLPLVAAASLLIVKSGYSRSSRLLWSFCLIVAVLGSTYTLREMTWSPYSVSDNLANLRAVDQDPRIQSINILGEQWWDILWETNFLLHKRLYFQTSTYAGREASRLDGEWDLIQRNSTSPIERTGDAENCIFIVNPSFVLRRATGQCRLIQITEK